MTDKKKKCLSGYREKSLNLNIFSHEGWSQEQALKELITNAIDEHEEIGISLSKIGIILCKNSFVIKDCGSGIKLENFCQGNSSKKNKNLRGFHGQGLRGAISRLLLEGYDIHIKSNFVEGKFIVKGDKRSIKMICRIPEGKFEGTEIQVFFGKNTNFEKFDKLFSDVQKDIIYFEKSYDKKIEEIKCKDGSIIDIYIPNKTDQIYDGGFFYKGIKLGIGKSKLDFGLIYNVKYSPSLEKKIRGEANFNRILEVKDTYRLIEHAFKDPSVLNSETLTFFKEEIESKCEITNTRISPKIKGQHKYKDLARKPIWEVFVTGKKTSEYTKFFDEDYIEVTRGYFEQKPTKIESKYSEQSVTITKENYVKDRECEKIFEKLKSKGFVINFSD